MKALFLFTCFLFLSLSVLATTKKLDTIDYWHVYYNNTVIAKYNEVDEKPAIVIKKNKIRPDDALSVDYGNDTPCHDCVTGIYIKDRSGKKIKLVNGKGTFLRLKVPMIKILTVLNELNEKTINFYYYDTRRDRCIFSLRIE